MYKEEILQLNILDKTFDVLQITNIDEVFDKLLESNKEKKENIDDLIPYWTELWPSAMALSEVVLLEKDRFTNKSVIEIGSGLGLPSIVASEFASNVLITDLLPDALIFAKKNALLNNKSNIDYNVLDWRDIKDEGPKYDIILASDIAYERRFFEGLADALKKLMHQNTVIYFSEPSRQFTIEFIDKLKKEFNVNQIDKPIVWRGVSTKVVVYTMTIL